MAVHIKDIFVACWFYFKIVFILTEIEADFDEDNLLGWTNVYTEHRQNVEINK